MLAKELLYRIEAKALAQRGTIECKRTKTAPEGLKRLSPDSQQ